MKIPKRALASADTFADELRTRIEQGTLPSGTKLPSTLEWARALGVDHRLLQAGLGRLASQGLLERKPRLGTIVCGNRKRPCILLLSGWPAIPGKATYFSSIPLEARKQAREMGYRLEIYDNALELFSDDFAARKEAIEHLRETIERFDPAGYFQITFDLDRVSDLYPKYARPSVSFGSFLGNRYRVVLDASDFFATGLDFLAKKGRRKVLLIRHQRRINPMVDLEAFWKTVRKNRFLHAEVREHFDTEHFSGDYEARMEEAGYRLMKDIIATWQGRRKNYIPDSILVDDDVLMKGVGLALMEARVPVPEEIEIVVRVNAELRRHYPVPIVSYSVSIADSVRHSLAMLDARIARKNGIKAPFLLKGTIVDG